MEGKIKCGVIGAGWWATFAHIPALLAHPGAELVAIQNDNPQEVLRIARDFNIPTACTDTRELLNHDDISAVVVSSSPHMHFHDAYAALTLGKHVLIEKPMTLTAAESIKLVEVARKHNSQFLISCPWHYTSHATQAQALVRRGELGQIRMISILMTNPVSDLIRGTDTQPTHGTPYMYPRNATYSDPAISGGGQTYAQVCHAAAYLSYLTGARATEVFARFHNDGSRLDIYDALDLRMNDSSIVTIASTGATSLERKDFEVRVFGTEGMLFMDLWRGTLQYVPLRGAHRDFPDLREEDIYPHQAPAMNLIDSINDPSLNHSPAILGVAAMEILEGANRSARDNANVLVSSLMERSIL